MVDSFYEFEHAAPHRGGMSQVCRGCFIVTTRSLISCRWSQQRRAFGKPLSSQAVVRAKLAQMIARVESAHNWLENVTHQMNNVCHLPFILYFVEA